MDKVELSVQELRELAGQALAVARAIEWHQADYLLFGGNIYDRHMMRRDEPKTICGTSVSASRSGVPFEKKRPWEVTCKKCRAKLEL